VDTNPTLNFIVYVPTEKQYPLYLHNHQGKYASSNIHVQGKQSEIFLSNVYVDCSG